jgi:hypothetical protein
VPASTIAFVALMMEEVSASEISVNFRENMQFKISEDSCLHTRRFENLKSYLETLIVFYHPIQYIFDTLFLVVQRP